MPKTGMGLPHFFPHPMSTRSRHSYDEIRGRLLAGEFTPGTRLDFQQLAKELGVSTTPVREAISQLASEGMVRLVPRLGAIVPELDREEIEELYGVREAMETHAAFKCAALVSPVHLAELEGFVNSMEKIAARALGTKKGVLEGESLRNFLTADLAFHMTIIERASNRRLTKLAADSHAHARIFAADRLVHNRDLLDEACRQHRAIYDALARHDGEEARRQVALHIQRSLERTLSRQAKQRDSERWWRPN
jgi:DNA-binding GntR family transcriptional regulator